MPIKAVTNIQNNAAGPPKCIARATPAIFPVPTVPDNAVESAWKCDVSPLSVSLSYLPETILTACLKYRICGNFK